MVVGEFKEINFVFLNFPTTKFFLGMKNKKMFLVKANILVFIMLICGSVFLFCFISMINDFNWGQPFLLIIFGFITKEIYNTKMIKMWSRASAKSSGLI